jgi:hypothetical protein
MATIKFFLRGNKNPSTIYVKFKYGRNIDLRTATDLKINPDNFSNEIGEIIPTRDAKIKKAINRLKTIEVELIPYLENSNLAQKMTIKKLKEIANPHKFEVEQKAEIEKKVVELLPSTLTEYFKRHIAIMKSEPLPTRKAKSSISKYVTTLRILERMEIANKTTYKLTDINKEFGDKFIEYCSSQGYALNTTGRNVKCIKTICFAAENEDIIVNSKFKSINGFKGKTPIVYLELSELKKIKETEFEAEYLDNARDWLLIACFTAQRVSDFLRFTPEMITEVDGEKLIQFTQQKTNLNITIPIFEPVQEILKKRNGNFPRRISDVKLNVYIKEVCKIAGIDTPTYGGINNPKTNRKEFNIYPKWQLVCSHIGRRAFSSNYFGILPISDIITMTGHTTEKALLTYIGKSEQDKAVTLSKKFKNLNLPKI